MGVCNYSTKMRMIRMFASNKLVAGNRFYSGQGLSEIDVEKKEV
jgi:hypothetical protein